MTLPFTGYGSLLPSTGPNTPELSGTATTVGSFTISPTSGPVGSAVQLIFEVDKTIPGLTVLIVTMDGEPLGDPINLTGTKVTTTRIVPDLPPGVHEIEVAAGDVAVSSVEFTVTETAVSGAGAAGIGTWPWIVLMLLVGAVLVWRLVEAIRSPQPARRRWWRDGLDWPRWRPGRGVDKA